jgi:hypothetical protein
MKPAIPEQQPPIPRLTSHYKPENNIFRGGWSDIVVGCDCIDVNQLAPMDYGLLCSETREQFYASRHHMVHRRYVGIRSFGAELCIGLNINT